jgi:hypothetical protein
MTQTHSTIHGRKAVNCHTPASSLQQLSRGPAVAACLTACTSRPCNDASSQRVCRCKAATAHTLISSLLQLSAAPLVPNASSPARQGQIDTSLQHGLRLQECGQSRRWTAACGRHSDALLSPYAVQYAVREGTHLPSAALHDEPAIGSHLSNRASSASSVLQTVFSCVSRTP